MSDLDPYLRCATIGCGRIGVTASPGMASSAPAHLQSIGHLQSIQALGIASATAACDNNPAVLERVRGQFGVTETFTDYQRMFEEFQPDLVTVATRTPEKAKIVQAARAAGVRGIHLEKPLCNTPIELAYYRTLKMADNLILSNGCMRRYLFPFQQLHGILNDPRTMDHPHHASVSMGKASLFWTQFHAIELLLYLGGTREVDTISAWMEPLQLTSEGSLDNDPLVISLIMQFDDGMIGEISAKPGHTTTAFAGNIGMCLHSDGLSGHTVSEAKLGDAYLSANPMKVDFGLVNGMQGPIKTLARALREDIVAKRTLTVAYDDFLQAQNISFACVESALQGGAKIQMAEFRPVRNCWGKTDGRFA